MNDRTPKRGFASRPADAESWIKAPDVPSSRTTTGTAGFTARLTIDITPALRGRIKIVAFERGLTVSDMLRDLLVREFPTEPGAPS